MHFSSKRSWALLPSLVSAVASSISLPHSFSSEGVTAIQNIHIDNNSAQASFVVPCTNCLGTPEGYSNQSFLFDFEAFPTEEPCGSSNLTLNGVPLSFELREGTGNPRVAQGVASVNSSGHELNIVLRSDCLFADSAEEYSTSSASQLLTLAIEKVDAKDISSLSGFTVSFKQAPNPDLLRLSLVPDFKAREPANLDDWRTPPANLRLYSKLKNTTESETATKSYLDEQLHGLKQLEAQAELLQKLIQEKRKLIESLSEENSKALKEEIKQCDSVACVLKAIVRKLHDKASKLCSKFSHSKLHDSFMNHWPSNKQAPSMMSASKDSSSKNVGPILEGSSKNNSCLQAPDAAHCREEKPTVSITTSVGEKSYPTRTPHASSEPQWKEAHSPSPLTILLKTLFLITGLAFLCGFIRRRCMSLRKRAERAADLEQRRAERLYRRDARRQAWRDWWFGRRRGQPGRRTGDYDEKRTLILRQEGILEEAMQDDIRQLQIEEEIRQLRNTRDAVDSLVRAEEGRSGGPMHYASTSARSYHPYAHRQSTTITIPNVASVMYLPSNPFQPESHHDDDQPSTPLSRTSSLPDYKTEASSEPPSYDDDELVADGFSDYTPSTGTHWSPASSIPDISPRPSIETARTFL